MRTLFFFVFFFFVLIFWGWWFLSMPNVFYSEKDFFKYNLLTYNEIRNSPRVSENYVFEYSPNDETSPQRSTIYFCDLKDISSSYNELVHYINENGFFISRNNSLLYKDSSKDDVYFILDKVIFNKKECLELIFSKEIK